MTDYFSLNEMFEMLSERAGERLLYRNGITVLGGFVPYVSGKDITSADFLQYDGEQISVAVRFSGVFGPEGLSDTIRDMRGMGVRFYTEKGRMDVLSQNLDISRLELKNLVSLIRAFDEYYKNKLFNDKSLWDLVSDDTEMLGIMLRFFSDLCTIRSYRYVKYYGFNEYIMRNRSNTVERGRFVFVPESGTRTIDRRESEFYAGFDPGIATRELVEAIENGEKIEFFVEFDMEGKDSLRLGKLWIDDIAPEDIHRNFCVSPYNTVQGIELSRDVDQMTALIFAEEERRFSHREHR